ASKPLGAHENTRTARSGSKSHTRLYSKKRSGAVKVSQLEIDDQPGFVERPVRRHRAGASTLASDQVGQEWPVARGYNGISDAVMMCTPRDLEAFVVGFSLTEGIIERGSDIHDIEVSFHDHGDALPHAEVQVQVVQQSFMALKDKRRALAGRTGCGVCGIES